MTSPFEDWPLPAEPFDGVCAATAFHWLDPAVRFDKCAAALRPGGVIAIVHRATRLGRNPDSIEVTVAVRQDDLAAVSSLRECGVDRLLIDASIDASIDDPSELAPSLGRFYDDMTAYL